MVLWLYKSICNQEKDLSFILTSFCFYLDHLQFISILVFPAQKSIWKKVIGLCDAQVNAIAKTGQTNPLTSKQH